MRPGSFLRRGAGPALVALLLVGVALGYAFWQETPVGRVQGRVRIAGTDKPLENVEVLLTPVAVPNEGRPVPSRRARTGPDGRFALGRVAAGRYRASASSRAHAIEAQTLTVDEGGTATLSLSLTRSQPDLQVAQHQRVFAATLPKNAAPTDRPFLPVRGYVDGNKPQNKDTLRVRVFRTRLSDVLPSEPAMSQLEEIARTYWSGREPAQGPGAKALPRELLDARPRPQLVSQTDVRITEADREGFFISACRCRRPGPACTWWT
jgi:hypothetical protein